MSCKECKGQRNKPCNTCDKGCLSYPKGKCVEYTGPTTEFLKIPYGLNLDDIILGLDSVIASLQDQILDLSTGFVLNTTNSLTASITGNGTNIPLQVNVLISTSPGNTISVNNDGLFVQANNQIFSVVRVSSTGIGLSYTFPHNSVLPTITGVILTPASQDAADYSFVDIDSSNVTVYYNVAPPAGTNNLKYFYTVY